LALCALSPYRFSENGGGYTRFRRVLSVLHGESGGDPEQLKKILSHAVKNVEFYKTYSDFRGLADFPVVNKAVIRNNGARMLARGFDPAKQYRVSTSGSTGTPFVVYHDAEKRRQAAADTMAFSEFAGYRFGTRLYYVRAWDCVPVKGGWYSKLRNIVCVNNRENSAAYFQRFLEMLERDSSEKSVLIYASTLTELWRYMKTNDVKTTAKVRVFITMSEALPDDVRRGIAERFGAPVVSRYSDCECGLIAQQLPGESDYRVNEASFHVEVLKLDSDVPAALGELGRIVITDLYNFAMPMIRYDTGDLGVAEKRGNALVLSRVEGRKADCIYATNGEPISFHTFANSIRTFDEVNQYQVVQNGARDYVLKLNLGGAAFPRERELAELLKSYLGADAILKIEYTDEIPVLSSGKRRCLINNFFEKH